jgi:hypothetical protein
LCAASCDQFGGVIVQEVFVDSEVLFFGENGVVGLEAILFEELGIALGLDI